MEPIARKESRFSKGWLLVGVGVLLLLTLAGIGAALRVAFTAFGQTLGQLVTTAMQQGFEAMAVVFDFGGNLWVGDIETAYTLTTEEFQSHQGVEEFAEFVAQHPELRSPWAELAGAEQTGDTCVYQITAEVESGRRSTFKLRLRKEKEKWKVDEIVLP